MFTRLAIACGLGAAVSTLSALTLLARAEGKSPLRPLNATSHMLVGPSAGKEEAADPLLTSTGIATNIAASFFWGSITAAFLAAQDRPSAGARIATAAAVTSLAGVVDYGLVPKRLTPGWELALNKKSVTLAMAAMGIGMAAGALIAASGEDKDWPEYDPYRTMNM